MSYRDIYDLRTALAFLNKEKIKIKIVEKEISPYLEISSFFSHLGAGIPSQNGNISTPVIFNNVRGNKIPVLMGLMNSRNICAKLLGLDYGNVGKNLSNYISNEYPPELISNPLCQENKITSNTDIQKILPVLTFTNKDAGPYINMGLVYAQDPETGEEDVTIHRLCLQDKDTLTIYLIHQRHIEKFYQKSVKMNKPLPISINIGLDPAIYLASTFSSPTTPFGFNELNIAGAIRQKRIKVAHCKTVECKAIAHAEIVLEGYILSDKMPENQLDNKGYSLPEFLGYIGKAQSSLPIVKIIGITYRNNAIYQTLVGPGAELSNICGISTEASLYKNIRESVTDKIVNCYCGPSGGGKLVAFMQFKKTSPLDDSTVRQAGIAAFSAFHELKHVFLVDEDINIFDERDVFFAMTTRFQGNESIITIPNLNGHPLDPSQDPQFSQNVIEKGTTCKTVFDCTVPFKMKNQFIRVTYDDHVR